MAQALTANRLIDGEVVYWRAGAWTEAFGEAEVFAAETEAKAALGEAQRCVAANEVVNPYLFDVRDGRPAKEREIIRALGPSIRTDLGKQACGHPPGALRARSHAGASSPPQGGGNGDGDVSL
jgi:hypothetical protein